MILNLRNTFSSFLLFHSKLLQIKRLRLLINIHIRCYTLILIFFDCPRFSGDGIFPLLSSQIFREASIAVILSLLSKFGRSRYLVFFFSPTIPHKISEPVKKKKKTSWLKIVSGQTFLKFCIIDVHGKPMLHVSFNRLFGGWPPSCATPPS